MRARMLLILPLLVVLCGCEVTASAYIEREWNDTKARVAVDMTRKVKARK